MTEASSRRRGRLSRATEFERVYRRGRSKANRYLVLHAFAREAAEGEASPRLGLSVSRRVGGAVDRSRVKRVLREAFRLEAARLPAGADYVIVARPDVRVLDERGGMPAVRECLGQLVDALATSRPAEPPRS